MARRNAHVLDADVAVAVRRLEAVMALLRKLEPALPSQVAHFFFHAATHPGKSVTDIGRAIQLQKSAAQRAFQALSDDHWDKRVGREAMGLLFAVPNPQDPRLHAVYL